MVRLMISKCAVLLVSCLYLTICSTQQFDFHETDQGYTLIVDIPEIEMQTIFVNDKLHDGTVIEDFFTRVSIPGFTKNGAFGDPEELEKKITIALEHDKPEIQVLDIETKRIKLSHKLYPHQIDEGLIRASLKEKIFCYNSVSYTRAQEKKSCVSVLNTSHYRGQTIATLVCTPLHYDPISNELELIKKARITIIMKKPLYVRSWNSQFFDQFMRDQFINFRCAGNSRILSEPLNQKEKYLIIVTDNFKNNSDLKKFIEYRKETGFDVELVESNSVGTTKDDFKTFIRNKKPTYCLLVGPDKAFPTHLRKTSAIVFDLNIHSYNYYFFPDTNTVQPDIAHGLFFCDTDEGLKNIIAKTITTEKNIGSYPKAFVGFSGNDQKMLQLPANHTDIVLSEWLEYFKTINYHSTMIYRINTPVGGKKECIAAINKGVRFLAYNGHGGENCWAYDGMKDQMTYSDVQNMSNTTYPFTLSAACVTGKFKDTTCMGEYYTNHKALSVAFIGASELSSLGQHSLGRGVMRALIEKKITKYGLAFMSGVCYVADSSGGDIDDMMKKVAAWQYHYFGDPAIETMNAATPINTVHCSFPQKNSLSIKNMRGTIVLNYQGVVTSAVTVSIYTVQGVRIQQKKYPISITSTNKPLSILLFDALKPAAGTYFVELSHDNNTVTQQFHYLLH